MIVVLVIGFAFCYIFYQLGLQDTLFSYKEQQGTITSLLRITSLVLMMGIVFAIDAVRLDGRQLVLRWSVSSIITAYSYTTSAAIVLTDLFSDQTLGIVASITLLCLGLVLVRLAASWPITLAAVVGCGAALAIINTGFTYTRSFVSRAALYLCGSILLAELVLLLRLAFRIKEHRGRLTE